MAAMGDLRRKGFWLIVSCLSWGVVTAAFGAFDMQLVALALIALIGMLSSWNMSLNRGMLQMAVAGRELAALSRRCYLSLPELRL